MGKKRVIKENDGFPTFPLTTADLAPRPVPHRNDFSGLGWVKEMRDIGGRKIALMKGVVYVIFCNVSNIIV